MSLIIVSFIFLVLIAALSISFWLKTKGIAEKQRELSFSLFETDYLFAGDFVEPKVNTIQFPRRGYSIVFDAVQYTQEGLELSGRIGNPTQLWISLLAVNFTARPYVYKVEEKWKKQSFPWWSDEWNIGSGQVAIGLLNPGSASAFHVTRTQR